MAHTQDDEVVHEERYNRPARKAFNWVWGLVGLILLLILAWWLIANYAYNNADDRNENQQEETIPQDTEPVPTETTPNTTQ